ncbi:hypothetical protein QFZ91_008099 [Paraburkholderia sp. JPY419]
MLFGRTASACDMDEGEFERRHERPCAKKKDFVGWC